MLSKLRRLAEQSYAVPWCVPAWGWREAWATCAALLSGHIVRGRNPGRVAAAVRRYLGVAHALPVNRGRTALELGLRALGIGDGDEVVLPSYLCRTALDAVLAAGARPVYADVEDDLNVSAATVRAALTARTRCVIVAHLFGRAAPIEEIEGRLRGTGVALIDDAAQSLGARRAGRLVGTFGDCGIVSCGPGKALAGAAGGVLVTNDDALARRAAAIALEPERAGAVAGRLLGFWFWRRFRRWTLPLRVIADRLVGPEREPSHVRGPMANVDAAILLRQLAALESNARRRRRHADELASVLAPAAESLVPNTTPADMAVKLVAVLPPTGPDADEWIRQLARAGVECQRGYQPLHLRTGQPGPPLPRTESLWERVLCIPIERAAGPRRVGAAVARLHRPPLETAPPRPVGAPQATGA